MGKLTRPIDKLARDTAEYVDMQIDDTKYKTADGLAKASTGLVAAILLIAIGTIILGLAALAGVLLVGDIVGSYALGAGIVAAAFVVLFLVVYAKRKTLLKKSFEKAFKEMLFEEEKPRPTADGIKAKRKAITDDIEEVKDFYNPSNFIKNTLIGMIRGTAANLRNSGESEER